MNSPNPKRPSPIATKSVVFFLPCVYDIRVSIAPYLQMDCKSLATEQTSLVREAEILGALVDQEYSSDKNDKWLTDKQLSELIGS